MCVNCRGSIKKKLNRKEKKGNKLTKRHILLLAVVQVDLIKSLSEQAAIHTLKYISIKY